MAVGAVSVTVCQRKHKTGRFIARLVLEHLELSNSLLMENALQKIVIWKNWEKAQSPKTQ